MAKKAAAPLQAKVPQTATASATTTAAAGASHQESSSFPFQTMAQSPISSYLRSEGPVNDQAQAIIRDTTVERLTPEESLELSGGRLLFPVDSFCFSETATLVRVAQDLLLLSWDGPARLPTSLPWHYAGKDFFLENYGSITCTSYGLIQWPIDWRQQFRSVRIAPDGDRHRTLIRIREARIPLQPMAGSSLSCVPLKPVYIEPGGHLIFNQRQDTRDYVKIYLGGKTIVIGWFEHPQQIPTRQTLMPTQEWQVMQHRLFQRGLRLVCHTQDGRPAAYLALNRESTRLTVSPISGVTVTQG